MQLALRDSHQAGHGAASRGLKDFSQLNTGKDSKVASISESLSITASKTPKDLELLQLGGDSREEISPGNTWDNFPRGILDCFLSGDLIFSTHWIVLSRSYGSNDCSIFVGHPFYTKMSSGEEQRLVTYGHVAGHWQFES